jgi:hypothetical protein
MGELRANPKWDKYVTDLFNQYKKLWNEAHINRAKEEMEKWTKIY